MARLHGSDWSSFRDSWLKFRNICCAEVPSHSGGKDTSEIIQVQDKERIGSITKALQKYKPSRLDEDEDGDESAGAKFTKNAIKRATSDRQVNNWGHQAANRGFWPCRPCGLASVHHRSC